MLSMVSLISTNEDVGFHSLPLTWAQNAHEDP